MMIKVFSQEPSFAELWDACVHSLLYSTSLYTDEVQKLLSSYGFSKKAKILDASAGTGFISLYLRAKGYSVDCLDLMKDQIDVFKINAKKLEVSNEIQQGSWEELPDLFRTASYDCLFCRGNSFIYANGGWNGNHLPLDTDLITFEKTLRHFKTMLRPGGILYIDKFPDSEVTQKITVGTIQVKGAVEDLLFCTERFSKTRKRMAAMIRRDSFGSEKGVPNETYDLRGSELESLLEKVGFSSYKKVSLKTETHFDVWIAIK